jgi:hypothetical protein
VTSQAAMPVMIYSPRNPNSLFNRFKTLSARISKFVAIKKAVTAKESGWEEDAYFYDACRTIYMNGYLAILMTFVQ